MSLNHVLAEMKNMLGRLIEESVRIEFRFAPDLSRVKVDPGQVEQVILNLAVNARDAMPAGGILTIETANVELDEHYAACTSGAQPGAHVMLSVSDTGTGTRARRPGAPVRAVLHHEGQGIRHGAGPGHCLRHRQAKRREHLV